MITNTSAHKHPNTYTPTQLNVQNAKIYRYTEYNIRERRLIPVIAVAEEKSGFKREQSHGHPPLPTESAKEKSESNCRNFRKVEVPRRS